MNKSIVRFTDLVRFAAACTLALGGMVSVPAAAQFFPTKPIRMVIPYPAGGSVDLSGRRVAEDLAVELGQPIVVENRSGANGIIATDFVAKAAPDGYTMLVSTLAAHAGNPSAVKALPYHPINDFAPVTVINTVPLLLVAHPTFPAQTVADVVRLAKERPGQINYASFGTGGMAHLAGVQLELRGGVNMTHVPYKGGAPALADVLGGHVQLFFSGINSALPHVKVGASRRMRSGSPGPPSRMRSATSTSASNRGGASWRTRGSSFWWRTWRPISRCASSGSGTWRGASRRARRTSGRNPRC